MSVLKRLLGSALGRLPAKSIATTTSTRPVSHDAVPPQGAWATLEREVRELSSAGRLGGAVARLAAGLNGLADAQVAHDLLKRLVVPLLDDCVQCGDSKTACALEHVVYERLIKKFEEPAHYERCFSSLDQQLHALGRKDRRPAAEQAAGPASRLLFFLHNMGDDLAHMLLLIDLVEAFLVAHPNQASAIGFAGICIDRPSPRLRALQEKWGVSVHPISHGTLLQNAYVEAAGMLGREGFDRLVVVAFPVGLSYLSGLVGDQLVWLSMKFELGCFDHLRHRCSFAAGEKRTREIGGRIWHEAPPLFTDSVTVRHSNLVLPAVQAARRLGTVFYTVNREEKIRNPIFLDAVAAILTRVPNSAFLWTGRQPLADIVAHFAARGLAERHFFAGWVDPDDLLVGGDIFLDTPVLSGTVAARAAVAGIPVVSAADSHSWVNFFWPTYERERESPRSAALASRIAELREMGLTVQSTDMRDYVDQAVRLAGDVSVRRRYGGLLAEFAQCYFFDARRSALAHFENLRC